MAEDTKKLPAFKEAFKGPKYKDLRVDTSKVAVESVSSLRNLPGYEANGTLFGSPEEIYDALGEAIHASKLAVGEASSSDKSYGSMLARGEAVSFIQQLAQEGKTTIAKLMEKLAREGMHPIATAFAESYGASLKTQFGLAALAGVAPQFEPDDLSKLLKEMKKDDSDVPTLEDISVGAAPTYLARYAGQKWPE